MIGYNISTEINNKSLRNALNDGANIVQIFTDNPCCFNYNSVKTKKICDIIDVVKKNNNLKYVIHGSFLINLCRNYDDKITKNSIYLLKKDLEISNKINALGVVIHMGKNTGKLKYEDAFNMYIKNLNNILSITKGNIILETGAGCGSEVATKLNELGMIRNKCIDKDRIKFCIDTCHIYSAGYDLCDNNVCISLENYIDNTLGWENVVLAHINDSKECFNSKKDRHADIVDGIMSQNNLNSFMNFINYFKKRNIPMILETPSDIIDYKTQIDFIKYYK
jgi:deoxyribonuclease IV